MLTLLCLLACYGLTYVFVDSDIFSPFRLFLCGWSKFPSFIRIFFSNLLTCYFCTGFWASLAIAGLLYATDIFYLVFFGFVWVFSPESFKPLGLFLWIPLWAFAGATVSYLVDKIIRYFDTEN